MAEPLLETRGLGMTVRQADEIKTLFSNWSWQLERGRLVALLGANGAGKTTLLQILAGLTPASAGEVRLCGKAIEKWDDKVRAQNVGILQQLPEDAFPVPVSDYVALGAFPHDEPASEAAISAVLVRFALQGFEGRKSNHLSGGEAQRMALATLWLQDPKLLLLDEPFNHLDWHHQELLLRELRIAVGAGKSIIVVMHDANLARRVCDDAILMLPGGIQTGAARDILTPEKLSLLYQHPIEWRHDPQMVPVSDLPERTRD